uniref:BZIP domain-containing protein n=1 Tax=Ananas comosus var. bracteatus TaxID=296719 RepID=A0A6V7PI28_ANACO|nr:unnamed protein product [Ananas comosus var. bracteatus]
MEESELDFSNPEPADQSADSAEKSPSKSPSASSKKRPFGNREAVRKYREKKKAHTASLEDEVAQLRAMNEQLTRRLQGQAALEAEVARLRCLLVDIRGRIEGEIGSFPYQKIARAGVEVGGRSVSDMRQGNLIGGSGGGGGGGGGGAQVVNSCDFPCDDQMYCFNVGVQGRAVGENGAVNGQGFGVCEMANVECMGNGSKSFVGCGPGSVMTAGCSSNAEKN